MQRCDVAIGWPGATESGHSAVTRSPHRLVRQPADAPRTGLAVGKQTGLGNADPGRQSSAPDNAGTGRRRRATGQLSRLARSYRRSTGDPCTRGRGTSQPDSRQSRGQCCRVLARRQPHRGGRSSPLRCGWVWDQGHGTPAERRVKCAHGQRLRLCTDLWAMMRTEIRGIPREAKLPDAPLRSDDCHELSSARTVRSQGTLRLPIRLGRAPSWGRTRGSVFRLARPHESYTWYPGSRRHETLPRGLLPAPLVRSTRKQRVYQRSNLVGRTPQ